MQLTLAQVAEKLGVSKYSVEQLVQQVHELLQRVVHSLGGL